ncbi:MAG TPA: ABC transporter ATP-binding protein [Xanthobacteraceae bacterium]|nr:ABC transporter ATP-binding protein [Xanthobacteraceae bacterium]
MIQIAGLHVRYQGDTGEVHAVRGIDLQIKEGQFYTLLGPSGCGKTSTLRCLAGLEAASEGEISIAGNLVYSSSRRVLVPPHKRDIGMVFQSYAIWPHMTAFENVAFPLREMRRVSRSEVKDRVSEALRLVRLSGLEDRPAPFLSGGQQQRLALARALVRQPKVLLLDEPLSNLDAKLREDTRVELRELVKKIGITTVYVTHDQLEALTMSDVVAVMNEGRIVQEASPVEIYRAPKERFVANFIGLTNFLEGQVSRVANGSGLGVVDTPNGALHCILPPTAKIRDTVTIVIRPEDIALGGPVASAPEQNLLEGKVVAALFVGEAMEYQLELRGGTLLRLKLHASAGITTGDNIRVEMPAKHCRALTA